MLKIESNLKINGRHWGLQFADGIAYTTNVALAAKLLLKGYVVTDRPVAGAIIKEHELPPAPLSPAQADTGKPYRSLRLHPLKAQMLSRSLKLLWNPKPNQITLQLRKRRKQSNPEPPTRVKGR